jgi:hypothetical protein
MTHLRNYSVPASFDPQSLHPKGNPIEASYTSPISNHLQPFSNATVAIDGEWRFLCARYAVVFDKSFPSLAAGVGNNEDSVADVRGTNGGSRYAMPLRIIPDLGQRPKNSVQSPSKQRCHVFQHNDSRSEFANHANGFKEQSGAFAVKSCPESGVGNILA